MEPSGSEASEAQNRKKGKAIVIDVENENVNQHVDEHVDEHFANSKQNGTSTLVKYLRSSSGRQESFEKGVEFEKVDSKQKPCLDVDTRCNSTFLMLETAVMFEKVFDRLELTDHDYASYFRNETEDGEEGTRMIPKTKKKKKNIVRVPNEDDWSNASLPMCYLLQLATAIVLFVATCKKMLNVVATDVVLFAAIDPQNKLKYLEFCLEQIYPKSQTSTGTSNQELYVHYKMKLDEHNDQTFIVSSSFTPSEDDCSMKIDLDDGFSKYLETQYGECDDFTEVDIYLKDGEEKRGDNSFDVLEAVSTACYTQNRSLIRLHYNKTPYELMHKKKPDLSFLHVFGSLCYPTNDNEDFGKLKPKADIGLVLNPIPQPPYVPPTKNDWDIVFQPMFAEFFNPPPSVVSLVPVAAAP
nr:zinc finger BED domain-containing protein RICESLEEPER 2-like [Tanacetum cinerariifolium]